MQQLCGCFMETRLDFVAVKYSCQLVPSGLHYFIVTNIHVKEHTVLNMKGTYYIKF